ncbi:MAG: heme-binding protein [Sphingomicrobium sp.]
MPAITLALARQIIDAAVAHAAGAGGPPIAAIVLDSGGFPVAFARQDGSSNLRYVIAEGKAWAALGLGVSSRALAAVADKAPTFISSMAAASNGRFVASPGGLLIADEGGNVIGALGVTGDTSDRDEEHAFAGIAAAGLAVAGI